MMPPVAATTCKFAGCIAPRYVYPSGWKCQYCREHMKYRKARSLDGQPSMTGQMRDILTYLRGCDGFTELGYPFAHGSTIKHLIERDWIFESHGIDGSVKYKITGRGLDALKVYEPPRQRRDGICPRCGIRPRYVSPSSGRVNALCIECERQRGRQRRADGKLDGNPLRPCSRCGKRPRLQYPGGKYSTYCHHCARVTRRQNNRINQRHLLAAVQNGATVPLCQHCKKNPRRVSAHSVSKYCPDCQRETQRRTKARHAVKRVFSRHDVNMQKGKRA